MRGGTSLSSWPSPGPTRGLTQPSTRFGLAGRSDVFSSGETWIAGSSPAMTGSGQISAPKPPPRALPAVEAMVAIFPRRSGCQGRASGARPSAVAKPSLTAGPARNSLNHRFDGRERPLAEKGEAARVQMGIEASVTVIPSVAVIPFFRAGPAVKDAPAFGARPKAVAEPSLTAGPARNFPQSSLRRQGAPALGG